MWSIRQTGESTWEVLRDGERYGDEHRSYQDALAVIATQLAADLAVRVEGTEDDEAGLLSEGWTNAPGAGIAYSRPTGDGRDFTDCDWTWRDPGVSLLPLMYQDHTDMGHFGAVLVGFIATLAVAGDAVQAEGRFYDSDAGREARDLLLGGRRFGVSVDPGAVDVTWTCLEEDDDGWCMDYQGQFTAYEIIGLTMTPFPAFAEAAIVLAEATSTETDDADDTESEEEAAAILASIALAIPTAPPREWFETAEPEPGVPFALGGLGEEYLVAQDDDGAMAMPLTITDDGRVLGHVARWGSCHIGYGDEYGCVTVPESASAYAHFHLGEVVCEDGSRVATGPFVAGCDHAAGNLGMAAARDHYAHNALAWCDVRMSDGVFGPWACGALRPGITPEQVRVLRAGSLSGDWRRVAGQLDFIAAQAVNTPGFGVRREAVVASGLLMPAVRTVTASAQGEPISLVAAGRVRRCAECARRARREATNDTRREDPTMARMLNILERLDRRTAHLRAPAAEDIRRTLEAHRG